MEKSRTRYGPCRCPARIAPCTSSQTSPVSLPGVPRSLYVPTQIQFLQTTGYVLILFERAHTYRVTPMTPGAHIWANVRLWMGDSRGHWRETLWWSTSPVTTRRCDLIRRRTSTPTASTSSNGSLLSIGTRCPIRSRLTIQTCTRGHGRWLLLFVAIPNPDFV